jgi:hypothetical protein
MGRPNRVTRRAVLAQPLVQRRRERRRRQRARSRLPLVCRVAEHDEREDAVEDGRVELGRRGRAQSAVHDASALAVTHEGELLFRARLGLAVEAVYDVGHAGWDRVGDVQVRRILGLVSLARGSMGVFTWTA